jgi:transcriptional regulator with XRE-family HTH domain
MRLRRGLTQEEVARAMGVDRGVVSRWERSENVPSQDRLWRLTVFLGARPEEQRALARGHGLAESLHAIATPSLEALEERLRRLRAKVESGDRDLMDLEFLAWQAAILPRAARSAAARGLLAQGWSHCAVWLTWDDRRREAEKYASRVLEVVPSEGDRVRHPSGTVQRAVHVTGLVIAQGAGQTAKQEAVEWLRMWLPVARDSPWEAMLYQETAENAWWAGWHTAALQLATRSCDLAEQTGDMNLVRACRNVRGDLWMRAGEFERSLSDLPLPSEHDPPIEQILGTMRYAQVLLGMGDPSASDFLVRACHLIHRYGYPGFRARADALAREF